jgi:CDP-diacylglycerol--serine O-phosphatidyltransferase
VVGFLAILAVSRMKFDLAVLCIAVAALLDLLDGPMARRRDQDGAFGCNLDSLADLLSFGAAPAFALYQSALYLVPVPGLTACLLFVVCGALRLARFPLVRNVRHFVGLPIPPAGLVVVLLAATEPRPVLYLISTFVLAWLMISNVPFPLPSSLVPRRPRYEQTPEEQPD